MDAQSSVVMSEKEIVVETRQLTRTFGAVEPVRALDGVDIVIRAGEYVAVVGPSGSGKSTLLNMLGALDSPSSGEVLIGGVSLDAVRNLDRFRSKTVGFVFQMHNLIPTLTALENVVVPLYEGRISKSERRTRAEELLVLVGLSHRLKSLPSQLSGGERQRVAIARSLANEPTIVLADEPTGNLDSRATTAIMELLGELNRTRGTTLIVVTHNTHSANMARRIITLRDGKVISDTVPKDRFERDLIEFRQSGLGQALVEEDQVPEELTDIAPALRELLRNT
jgi:ABC-type lipoprotein export system ATPase subunit